MFPQKRSKNIFYPKNGSRDFSFNPSLSSNGAILKEFFWPPPAFSNIDEILKHFLRASKSHIDGPPRRQYWVLRQVTYTNRKV